MISVRAKNSFNECVMLGMRSALVGPNDSITSLGPVNTILPLQEPELVMLSVASYRFRLMIVLYFSRDAASQAHFAGVNRVPPAEMTPQAFTDAIAECGNMLCGTFNREIGRIYPHVGMSTPNILDSRCGEHLKLMGDGHLQHFALHLQSGMRFIASLCVCEDGDLDFDLPPSAPIENTGELEFF